MTDANGCAFNTSVTLTEPTPLSASTAVTSDYNGQDISCFGAADGRASVTPSGATPTYTYSWSNGSTSATPTGLSVGTYNVTVTDANGCTFNTSVTLTEPTPLSASTAVTSDYNGEDISCFGAADGSASVTPTGATPTYTYSWSNGSTSATPGGLSVGTYNVTVTDANGCSVNSSVTLSEPTPMAIVPNTLNNVFCAGDSTGVVFVSSSGGVIPHSYLWNTGVTSDTLAGVPVGVYNVIATDANGCTISTNISVLEPNPLIATIPTINNVSCFDGSDGSMSSSVSGGVPAYSYLWNTGSTGPSISNLSIGTYTLTVTDNNGCSTQISADINQPTELNALIDASNNITCFGAQNGSAIANGSGGVAPYQFNWNTGDNTQMIQNLAEGIYYVYVLDQNGCLDSAQAQISEPEMLTISNTNTVDITCNGETNGQASIQVNGGTPIYTYSWSNGATTQNVFQLAAGNYTVTVTDNNGCQTSSMITIIEPDPIVIDLEPTHLLCYDEHTGSIEATVSGGTPDYQYNWSNFLHNEDIEQLGAGTYTLSVTDSRGCTHSESTTLTQPSPIVVDIINGSSLEIFAGDSIYLSSAVSGGSGNYTYNWVPPQNVSCSVCPSTYVSPSFTGYYDLYVTDSNGCVAEASTHFEIINTFYIPNAFTPDNDGINDYFKIEAAKVQEFKMFIFDRWGEVVFKSENIDDAWDGTYGNFDAKSDVYVYKINVKFIDKKQENIIGHVTLIR